MWKQFLENSDILVQRPGQRHRADHCGIDCDENLSGPIMTCNDIYILTYFASQTRIEMLIISLCTLINVSKQTFAGMVFLILEV